MKYYHSDIYRSKNWLDTDEVNPLRVIKKYYNDHCVVYDADQCGNGKVEFAFEMPEGNVYYELTYDWYMDYEPEWEIHNSRHIEKITEPTFEFPGNRDWIDVWSV